MKDILTEILKDSACYLIDGIEVKSTDIYKKLIEETKGINPINSSHIDENILLFDKGIELFAYEVLRFDEYKGVHSDSIEQSIESSLENLSEQEFITICDYYNVLDNTFKFDPSNTRYLFNKDDERISYYRARDLVKDFILNALESHIDKFKLFLRIHTQDTFWYSLYISDFDNKSKKQHDKNHLAEIMSTVNALLR